ncbi:MAG TPA: hypothetical protein IAB66_01260 [Candidatus Caccousia avistercoris]|nr:hypothetical protein [Candidatus Caccousia avistercoris]
MFQNKEALFHSGNAFPPPGPVLPGKLPGTALTNSTADFLTLQFLFHINDFAAENQAVFPDFRKFLNEGALVPAKAAAKKAGAGKPLL